MLLPRRALSSLRRIYGRVLVLGASFTLLLFLLYKVHQTGIAESNEVDEPLPWAVRPDGGVALGKESVWLRYEQQVENDLKMQRPGLGDNGEAVRLTGSEEERGEKDLANIALNEELSRHLSFNRTTPDGRNPHCKKLRYDTKQLPTAAVIIIFFDEPFSVILRTVHSVLNTASENLKEVILVDDASTHVELHGKLDHYVETRLPKTVKLLRMKNR